MSLKIKPQSNFQRKKKESWNTHIKINKIKRENLATFFLHNSNVCNILIFDMISYISWPSQLSYIRVRIIFSGYLFDDVQQYVFFNDAIVFLWYAEPTLLYITRGQLAIYGHSTGSALRFKSSHHLWSIPNVLKVIGIRFNKLSVILQKNLSPLIELFQQFKNIMR